MADPTFEPGVYDRAVEALGALVAQDVDSSALAVIEAALTAGRAADESSDGLYAIYNEAIGERDQARAEVVRLREVCRGNGVDAAEILDAQLGNG